MRFFLYTLILSSFVLLSVNFAKAEVADIQTLTENLSLGSRSSQVVLLQKILNSDTDTRIADIGIGSEGNETSYFGSLTKAAVIRFQTKYANEILTPSGLTSGNGRVGSYTRAKLNKISIATTNKKTAEVATSTNAVETSTTKVATDYSVKENEKTDIYAGDKMIESVQKKLLSAMNTAITQTSRYTAPAVTMSDMPSVTIKTLLPQYGVPGTRVAVSGNNISSSSVIYFGNNYIIRSLDAEPSGNFSFTIPPIPTGQYDLAIRTGSSTSRTMEFVITDPKNPLVYIQSISPETVMYDRSITITGSGFTSQNNTVVTNFQKFTNVPSADSKTLTIQIAPENLREAARVGNGLKKITMYIYVVNEYGFSNPKKYFNMTL